MMEEYQKIYVNIDGGKLAERFGPFSELKDGIDKANDNYPQLAITFSNDQINALKGIIDSNGQLDSSQMKTPIEKLLYAFLWKQKDIGKVIHIVEGMTNDKTFEEKRSPLIFYQFGKHLSDNTEPIIDQNVLRAFALYKGHEDALTKNGISKAEKGIKLVTDYIDWIKSLVEGKKYPLFIIDRIMFVIGQKEKSRR